MSAVEIAPRPVTPEQAAEEQSLFFALFADSFMLTTWVLVGVLGGSLTVIAESIRGGLMMSIEVFAYVLMRRLHRDQLTDLEFGTGKLEQVANLLIGGGMLAAAAWIFSGALAIVAGAGPPAYPGVPGHEPDLTAARKDAGAIDAAMDELRRVVPDAGSYVSESNFFEPEWQRSFWGPNYPRLQTVKTTYDPAGLFFVHHGVGSEDWSADGFTRVR